MITSLKMMKYITVSLIVSPLSIFGSENVILDSTESNQNPKLIFSPEFICYRFSNSQYQRSIRDFSIRLLKEVARDSDHFAISQYSIWLTLAAIAEGNKKEVQEKLFKTLNLPKDLCLRTKYYELATSLESPGNDVTISRERLFIINDNLKINQTWIEAVRSMGLVDARSKNIDSDCVITDRLNYENVWTEAFDKTEMADFFDDFGNKIGTVEMMTTVRKIKMLYVPFLNADLLELPVGNNGRYRMFFIKNVGKNTLQQTIRNFPTALILDSLLLTPESLVPLKVSLPRFTNVTSHHDMKVILERMGVVWRKDDDLISDPPVSPSYTQTVSLNISTTGLATTDSDLNITSSMTKTDSRGLWTREFTANRPFVYGLVDSYTRTWLFSGVFAKP